MLFIDDTRLRRVIFDTLFFHDIFTDAITPIFTFDHRDLIASTPFSLIFAMSRR